MVREKSLARATFQGRIQTENPIKAESEKIAEDMQENPAQL